MVEHQQGMAGTPAIHTACHSQGVPDGAGAIGAGAGCSGQQQQQWVQQGADAALRSVAVPAVDSEGTVLTAGSVHWFGSPQLTGQLYIDLGTSQKM